MLIKLSLSLPVLVIQPNKIYNRFRNDVELNFHAVSTHTFYQKSGIIKILNKIGRCIESKLMVISSPELFLFILK
jgi:hypothetical protein